MLPVQSLILAGLIAAAGLTMQAPAAHAQAEFQLSDAVSVVIASPTTDGKLVFADPLIAPRGRFKFVQVSVKNVSGVAEQLEYRVDWFEESGLPIETVKGWQTLFLSPGEVNELRSMGQHVRAHSARITVREPEFAS